MLNNYIVTIDDEIHSLKTLGWRDLYQADFNFNQPFQINLPEGQFFLAQEVVRIIPKKRLVAFGTWHDKPAVIKLFFDRGEARRHMKKDIQGMNILRENKIPIPLLYYQGKSEDKRIYVLIFARIIEAKNLAELWEEKQSVDSVMPLLRLVMIEIATQHVLGVLQHDLHLKNFLSKDRTIYTLDGGQIEHLPCLLPKKQSIANLALLLSQLGIGFESYQETLYRCYAKIRGFVTTKADIAALHAAIQRWHAIRWKKFERKIFRTCSNFNCIDHWRLCSMYNRKYAGPDFMKFLNNPDSAFHHQSKKILKNGRSTTVIKVLFDNHELVIKRYNFKNVWHRLRRIFRVSRAAKNWRLAQKLFLFGMPTAKPVAFIEKRLWGLRLTSYYVTEFIPGIHAGEFFHRYENKQEIVSDVIAQLVQLLKNIAKLKLTHGDLKITNILIDKHFRPVLIDLDGAKEHASSSKLNKMSKKEIKRFLQNFIDQPALYTKFKSALME